jgi:hypothetical protein
MIIRYQTLHGVKINASTYLSAEVSAALMPTFMSEKEFVKIENTTLFNLIRNEIRPTSTVDFFVRKFTSKLIFSIPADFILKAYNFQLWITYVKVYFREVLTRYEFLAEDLDSKLIPPCSFKEDGLIDLILRPMVPFHVAKNIHLGFYNKGTKFKNITDYLEAFTQQLGELSEKARESKAIDDLLFYKPGLQTQTQTQTPTQSSNQKRVMQYERKPDQGLLQNTTTNFLENTPRRINPR